MGKTGAVRLPNSFEQTYPGARASATECHINLIRAGLLADARVDAVLRPYDLSHPTFNVLSIVGRAGEPLPPHVISERMVVPRNTLTHTLDVLERRGLVQRRRHPHHRGMVLIELTEAGKSLLAEALARLHALEAVWWSAFTEQERQTMIALLDRVQQVFAHPDDPEALRAGEQPAGVGV